MQWISFVQKPDSELLTKAIKMITENGGKHLEFATVSVVATELVLTKLLAPCQGYVNLRSLVELGNLEAEYDQCACAADLKTVAHNCDLFKVALNNLKQNIRVLGQGVEKSAK